VNQKVAIIILNWDSWRDTVECLESLSLMDYQNYVPVIVDNGSSDGSIDRLREFVSGSLRIESKFFRQGRASNPIEMIEYTRDQVDGKGAIKNVPLNESLGNKNLVLIKNQRNYGFAEGNNVGIQFALDSIKPDYVLLLNSDTVVDPGFLVELVRIGESDAKIGAVGPKVYYYDNPSKINSAGGKMYYRSGNVMNIGIGEMDVNNRFDEMREVDCLHGSAILIKASVLEHVGLLDQDFFVLLEETEWCLRARKAGYKMVFAPTTRIYHKEGFSGTRGRRHYYYYNRNRILLHKKHQTLLRKTIYGLFITLRTLAGSVKLSVTGKPSFAICSLRGFFNGLRVKK
jgi:GT2 family glycosyltransferase